MTTKSTDHRNLLRCILPHEVTPEFAGRTDRCYNAHNILQRALCDIAGGYTSYEMKGGWLNGAGKMEYENGTVYEVLFPVSSRDIAQSLKQAFRLAGAMTDQTWLHLEEHSNAFWADHTRLA